MIKKPKRLGLRIEESTALRLIQLSMLTQLSPSVIARIGLDWVMRQKPETLTKLAEKK